MTESTHWEDVWEIFEQAVGKPEGARAAFVAEACADKPTVERAVLGMLDADASDGTILDRQVVVRDDRYDPDRPGRPSPRTATASKHQTIGPYRVLRRVGEGGMSTAYLAVRADDAYRRQVVVKVVRDDMVRDGVLRRLRTERQILAGLEHPNIARLYDGAATADGTPYFAMELVDGLPIDVYCREHRLTIDRRVDVFMKVCAAVQHAHQNLIIHRDIKPSNILVTKDGEPKLLDFGIAKVLEPDAWFGEVGLGEPEPTTAADRMLTPSYASPEQYRGAPVTTASDVYSLGVLLYQLLTGCLPHDLAGRSPAEIERMLLEVEPQRPSLVAHGAPDGLAESRQLRGDLDAIVGKALRSTPEERYGTVDQLIADLARYRDGLPVTARRASWRYRAGKLVRRHRLAVSTGAVALASLSIAVAAILWQSRNVARERDAARLERDQKTAVIALIEDLITHAEPFRTDRGHELTARELVLGSGRALDLGLAEQPAVRAQLLHTSGSMLLRLGAFHDARDLLDQALILRRSLHPDGDLEVAQTLRVLAAVHKELGDFEPAEALAREAVAMARALPDAGAEDLASCLTALASVLCFKQAFDAAEEPIAEALALVRESVGGEPLTLINLEYVAASELRRGRYAEAVALLREIIERRRARYGERHPSQDLALNDLALGLRWLGDFEAAETVYEESRQLVIATYGTEHPDYALALNNIAGVRFARGDYAGALAAYQESRDVFAESVGEDHWRLFFIETNIEAARIRDGDAARASRNLRAARERWRPRLGEDHWLFAQTDSLLGEAAAAVGRVDEAEALLVESFERLIALRVKDRHIRKALDRLARFLEAQGRADEIPALEARIDVASAAASAVKG